MLQSTQRAGLQLKSRLEHLASFVLQFKHRGEFANYWCPQAWTLPERAAFLGGGRTPSAIREGTNGDMGKQVMRQTGELSVGL